MPNWYDNLLNRAREKTQEKHRWMFNIGAYVWMPPVENPEEERDTAKNVLEKRLKKIEGDASIDTLVDADIKFLPIGEGSRV
jgi:hypothetical protein